MSDHPGYPTLAALNKGLAVNLDGVLFVKDESKLALGDRYIGAHNTVDVYICKKVDTIYGWVHPVEFGNLSRLEDSVKVRFAPDGAVAEYTVPDEVLRRFPFSL